MPKHQRGYGLVEVMLASLLFSIGLLALSGLHYKSLQATKFSLQASLIASQMLSYQERMKANKTVLAKHREQLNWQQQTESLFAGIKVSIIQSKPAVSWQNNHVRYLFYPL